MSDFDSTFGGYSDDTPLYTYGGANFTSGEFILGGHMQRQFELKHGANPYTGVTNSIGLFKLMIGGNIATTHFKQIVDSILNKKRQLSSAVNSRILALNKSCKLPAGKENKTLFFSIPDFEPSDELVKTADHDIKSVYLITNGLIWFANNLSLEPINLHKIAHSIPLLYPPNNDLLQYNIDKPSITDEKKMLAIAQEYESFVADSISRLQLVEQYFDSLLV